jgi:phage I-like protein
VQLLPAGEFVGRDGRPGNGLTWKLSDAQGQALAARLTAKHATVQFNLDYEHQAMLADKNGQPAPASGWATAFEWRAGVGLFALNVQWTANAKRMIEGGEYKYISPVIVFDKTTGEVSDVLNASLVNIPNLDLNPVAQERMAALNAQFSTTNPEPTDMNPLLAKLLAALNLPATEATTEAQALGAVAALKAAVPAAVTKLLGLADKATEAEVTTAVTALKASADKAAELTTQVATLKAAAPGEPDPTKYVALDKFTELNNEVATLKAAGVDRTVDELITEARLAGKCSPVVEGVWRDIGKVDVAKLKALIDKTPANPALAGLNQTGVKTWACRLRNSARACPRKRLAQTQNIDQE